jgi:hypothetical protein
MRKEMTFRGCPQGLVATESDYKALQSLTHAAILRVEGDPITTFSQNVGASRQSTANDEAAAIECGPIAIMLT